MKRKIVADVFKTIVETKELLEQFSPEQVKDSTTIQPKNLIVEMMLRHSWEKKKNG